MRTRSSVLGKRRHQDSPNSLCKQLQTPDNTPNPKRVRTATVVVDGDGTSLPQRRTTSNLMELTLSTPPPSPPASLLPIQVRVRALLRSTCNNISSSIAGRDVECTSLLQFLTSFIDALWERIIEDLATTLRRKSTAKRFNSHDRLKALLSTLNTQWYGINIIFNYLTQA
jgi:hypothetical protein